MSSLRVIFDKPEKVYYSGEKITGRVEIVLQYKMKIRGVELKIKGRAKSKWQELKSEAGGGASYVKRKSTQIFIHNKQLLIGGKEKFKLPEGVHTYSFAVILPDDAPTSFSSRYGEISYHAKAKIDIPFDFDIEELTELTVIHPLILDSFPYLQEPYEDEKSMSFYCLWCASGPLTVVIRLPKTGFAAIESIPIIVDVDNASKETIPKIRVYLKRTICWTVGRHQKIKDSELWSYNLGRVLGGKSHTWSENIELPSISFPNLDGCTIIEMNHEVHIKAHGPPLESNLHMRVPVKISDVVFFNVSEVPSDTPSIEISPDNMADDTGIQMPAEEMPPRYPNHNSSEGNNSDPENSGEVSIEKLSLQICPSADPDHVVFQLEMNNAPPNLSLAESEMHTHENSVSVQQNPPESPSAPPSLSSQSTFNIKYSQEDPEDPYHPVADYGFELPSFNSDVQLEMTSFLNDSKDQATENDIVTPSLFPPSRN